jgi:hypothetical protein
MRWYLYTPKGQLVKSWKATKTGGRMTINNFAIEVSKKEGKKVQLSIAQISETLKVVNNLLGGTLYREIRKL